jgi:hypothetical protein
VVQVPTEVTAAQRARWLGELSSALEEAQSLIWRISSAEDIDLLDLRARIESARAEVRSLRLVRGNPSAFEYRPKWTNHSAWDQRKDCSGS